MTNSFRVTVRKKIPYLTNFLFGVTMITFSVLFLVYLFFLPAKDSSGEIQVAWYMFVVPNFIKVLGSYSLIILLIVFPLYMWLRIYKNAILTFLPDAISIRGRGVRYTLPIGRMRRVFCMNVGGLEGFRKEKLTVFFQQKQRKIRKQFIVRARLKYYVQADEFMEQLCQYENLEIKVYDADISPDYEEEI